MGGMGGAVPFGEASGRPRPASVETFHALRDRQTSDGRTGPGRRFNLLNWDGNGRPPGLFPERDQQHSRDRQDRTEEAK
jgi:nitrate reductase beta subunit